LKYAFNGQKNGVIDLKLEQLAKDILHLEISDNGSGKEPRGEIKGTGFGTQLINLLCHQLNGKMTTYSDHGTTCSFDFNIKTI